MVPLAAVPASNSDRRTAFEALRERVAALGKAEAITPSFPSGIADLDRLLGGGFPTGALVTLEGALSSGRWSIATQLLVQATRRGLGAVIDQGELYPPHVAQAGVRLDRLLVVKATAPLGIARAADILVRSRACRVVVMPAVVLRAAIWTRLAQLAHRMNTLLVVIGGVAAHELAGASALRVKCVLEGVLLRGTRGLWGAFGGLRVRAEACKRVRVRAGSVAHLSVSATLGVPMRERHVAPSTDALVKSGGASC